MERKVTFLIQDILDSIDKIERYIETVDSFEAFSENDMVL